MVSFQRPLLSCEKQSNLWTNTMCFLAQFLISLEKFYLWSFVRKGVIQYQIKAQCVMIEHVPSVRVACDNLIFLFKMIFYVIVLYILGPCVINHQTISTGILPRFSMNLVLNIHLFEFHNFPADSFKNTPNRLAVELFPQNMNMGRMTVPNSE